MGKNGRLMISFKETEPGSDIEVYGAGADHLAAFLEGNRLKYSTNPLIYNAARLIAVFRLEIPGRELPAYWIEFLLLIALSGEEGITTVDLAAQIGMGRAIASRVTKIMSRYFDAETQAESGYGLIVTATDKVLRHRQRLFLSEKGKQLCDLAVD